ncbi:hypothetical protein SISSUDRAFT_1128854 [Sistotremastrum suecicum HHB10207 ss-3]|uniref:F-box domain-containing protein n=1 Tax=Sistotremastrum suecicum HHB10207 ss-3 TaxID=1314776 RepID=A0A166DDN8_9AGAM|nr:hypothetical protein SISSUDRAFT_1128854 [Sistotremastrum suecicum HHB10207 ss-3]
MSDHFSRLLPELKISVLDFLTASQSSLKTLQDTPYEEKLCEPWDCDCPLDIVRLSAVNWLWREAALPYIYRRVDLGRITSRGPEMSHHIITSYAHLCQSLRIVSDNPFVNSRAMSYFYHVRTLYIRLPQHHGHCELLTPGDYDVRAFDSMFSVHTLIVENQCKRDPPCSTLLAALLESAVAKQSSNVTILSNNASSNLEDRLFLDLNSLHSIRHLSLNHLEAFTDSPHNWPSNIRSMRLEWQSDRYPWVDWEVTLRGATERSYASLQRLHLQFRGPVFPSNIEYPPFLWPHLRTLSLDCKTNINALLHNFNHLPSLSHLILITYSAWDLNPLIDLLRSSFGSLFCLDLYFHPQRSHVEYVTRKAWESSSDFQLSKICHDRRIFLRRYTVNTPIEPTKLIKNSDHFAIVSFEGFRR